MCGIIGILGDSPVVARLLDGLKRLEYRGYDSAGVATVQQHTIYRQREEGKLFRLAQLIANDPIPGTVGIGHTRWATHGSPSISNAHPHTDGRVSVVHNGIIENCAELRAALVARGFAFESDTDTEVVLHLVSEQLELGCEPLEAVQKVLPKLTGYFALVFLFRDYDYLMIGTKRGSPLILGVDAREAFLASDANALTMWTNQLIHLEEDDIVVCSKPGDACIYEFFDANGKPLLRTPQPHHASHDSAQKGLFAHYMLKEIHEQPYTLAATLQAFARPQLPEFDRIHVVACGTSYYVGLTSCSWFEQNGVATSCSIASEFRETQITPNTLYILISQSGETMDTLTALQKIKVKGAPTLAIVNVRESPIARQSDYVIATQAGPEIGVASTKASTAQLLVLKMLACNSQETCNLLGQLPRFVQGVIDQSDAIRTASERLLYAHSAFYLGRGVNYPIALEAALKLKEISYIHAEGFAAGEIKHGPIALIDSATPVMVLAPTNDMFDKMLLAIEQVHSRGAAVLVLTDAASAHKLPQKVTSIVLPAAPVELQPFISMVAVQFLAYFTALLKGNDVDQPRNLAKSVTVE